MERTRSSEEAEGVGERLGRSFYWGFHSGKGEAGRINSLGLASLKNSLRLHCQKLAL